MTVDALQITGLSVSYGPIQALKGVSLQVLPGSITALLGANGAGKTTLLRAVVGALASQGAICLGSSQIHGLPVDAVVRRGVALVPENRGTFAELTVEENLQLGAYTRADRKGIAADIESLYESFPRLAERRRQQAGTLSGGEQQMLAIGRALMLRPRFLLLDEPSLGLAPLVINEIFQILGELNAKRDVAMLLVEQNAMLALQVSSYAYLLDAGHVVRAGPSAELINDDTIRQSYLGATH
jgi:branched-chain amino acid transport system ATP-binding protein